MSADMVEPSASAESLELPSSTFELQFIGSSNSTATALLDDSLFPDPMAKHEGPPAAQWLSESAGVGYSLSSEPLIAVSGDLVSGGLAAMASSSDAVMHLDDDLDTDSKSVFTVHELGNSHESDVIGGANFGLVDTIIPVSMPVDPSVDLKPFSEEADDSDGVVSSACLPTVPPTAEPARRRGRKPKSLLRSEAAQGAVPAAASGTSINMQTGKKPAASVLLKPSKPAKKTSYTAGRDNGSNSSSNGSIASSSAGSFVVGASAIANASPSNSRTDLVKEVSASAAADADCVASPRGPASGSAMSSFSTSSTGVGSADSKSAPLSLFCLSFELSDTGCHTSGKSPASTTPGGSSFQPRRSVRICEQDPRDFLQELRQGHYLKPRVSSSPHFRKATAQKTADSPAAASGSASDSPATPIAATDAGSHSGGTRTSACSATVVSDGCPISGADLSQQQQQAEPAKRTPVSADTVAATTPGKKRKEISIRVRRADVHEGSSLKKKKNAHSPVSSSDSDASSSDDPDSVPLLQIKQKLTGPGTASPAATVAPSSTSAAAAADSDGSDPDSVPLVQIKRHLLLHEGDTGASKALPSEPVKKKKVGRPPKSAQSADGAVSTEKKRKLYEVGGGSSNDDDSAKMNSGGGGAPAAKAAAAAAATKTAASHEVPAPPSTHPRADRRTEARSDSETPTKQKGSGREQAQTVSAAAASSRSVRSEKDAPLARAVSGADFVRERGQQPVRLSSPAAAAASSSACAAGVPPPRSRARADGGATGSSAAKTQKTASSEPAAGSKAESASGAKSAEVSGASKPLAKPSAVAGNSAEQDLTRKGFRRSASNGGGDGATSSSGGSNSRSVKSQSDSVVGHDDEDELSSGTFTFVDNVDEEEGSDRDEENDPNRLWCVCKRPHDNRFMICCDRCQEWYHGDCVGISKARGKQMETNREEYTCMTCKAAENGNKQQAAVSARDDRAKNREEHFDTSTAKTSKKDGGQMGEIRKKQPSASKGSSSNSDDGRSSKRRMFKKFKSKPPKCQCVAAGCGRTAQPGTVYCSSACVRRYASDSLRLLESRHAQLQKLKAIIAKRAKASPLPSSAVIVIERHSSRIISGGHAPSRGTLHEFLLKHRSFEVLQPGQPLPKVTAIAAPAASPQRFNATEKAAKESPVAPASAEMPKQERKTSVSSSTGSGAVRQNSVSSTASAEAAVAPDSETIRRNVRKTLREMLWNRVKEADDISVAEDYVGNIAVAIEAELFNMLRDTGPKYRSKYRSLLFNIKDPKNKGLFRKLVKNRIKPDKLVRMSPEDLASEELMQWRESEMKHELDKIKEVEELRSHEEKPRVLHVSHKQEVELVNEDLSNLRQVILEEKPKDMDLDVKAKHIELEPADQSPAVGIEKTPAAVDTTSLHNSHLFDRNCKICTGQQPPPTAGTSVQRKAPKVDRHVHMAKDEKRHAKLQLSAQPREVIDRVVAREMRHLGRELEDMKRADAELMEQTVTATASRSPPVEPTSTVESPSTPGDMISTSLVRGNVTSALARTTSAPSPLWKGSLNVPEVVKFFAMAFPLAGPTEGMKADLPDALNVVGRIMPSQVWTYLGQLKVSTSKDVVILNLLPLTEDEETGYMAYYTYLSSKNRHGVVGHASKTVKDMYIIPVSMDDGFPSQLTQYLTSSVQSDTSSLRSQCLVSVIVRTKSKKPSALESGSRAKKAVEHKKSVSFASSELLDDAADADEPYDPETPALDYGWKPVAATTTTTLPASAASDPIVRAYAHPDASRLTALDVSGSSPYSPSRGPDHGGNDEAYDPADELLPRSAVEAQPARGFATADGDSEYKRTMEALQKRIEAAKEEAEAILKASARHHHDLGSPSMPATTSGAVASNAASILSPEAAALLLPSSAAAAGGIGMLPLPKALQDIMSGSVFAPAAAVATASAGDTGKSVAAVAADVFGYFKQTLDQAKQHQPQPTKPEAASTAVGPATDPRLAGRPALPADPRLLAKSTNSANAATAHGQLPLSAAIAESHQLSQFSTSVASAGQAALPDVAYFTTSSPQVAQQHYSVGTVGGVQPLSPVATCYASTTFLPAAIYGSTPSAAAEAVTIPGLGDGMDWSVVGGSSSTACSVPPIDRSRSHYLPDEHDRDERLSASTVAAPFASGVTSADQHDASRAVRGGQQFLPMPQQPGPHAEPECVDDFQDFDYRPRHPPMPPTQQAAGVQSISGSSGEDYGDYDDRQRVTSSRAKSGSPAAWHGSSGKSHSPEHRRPGAAGGASSTGRSQRDDYGGSRWGNFR